MRRKTDAVSLLLRRVGQIATSLRQYSVPDGIVSNFQKACLPLTPTTMREKAALLEPLAVHLFDCTKGLKPKSGAGVRLGGGMPKSVASAAAQEIAEALEWHLHLLPVMRAIFAELLNVKAYRAHESRSPVAREGALRILALQPDDMIISNRKLASVVGVEPRTIGRWKKDAAFKEDLRWMKELMVDPRWRSVFKDALHDAFPHHEELDFYEH